MTRKFFEFIWNVNFTWIHFFQYLKQISSIVHEHCKLDILLPFTGIGASSVFGFRRICRFSADHEFSYSSAFFAWNSPATRRSKEDNCGGADRLKPTPVERIIAKPAIIIVLTVPQTLQRFVLIIENKPPLAGGIHISVVAYTIIYIINT